MPVYNVEKYLDRSIMSVLSQSFQNIEVIVVNDGSTDGSHSIIDYYLKKDRRIKYIQQDNKGVSEARNLALSIAQGDYVYFIDADDYIEKDLLQDMANQIDEFNPEIIFFGYEMESIRSGRKIIKLPHETSYLNRNELIKNFDLIEHNIDINSLWNKIYSKKFLDQINVTFPAMSVGEDAIFNYQCLQSVSNVNLVRKKYYHYSFERPGSAINTISLNRMEQRLKVVTEYEYLCQVLQINRQEEFLIKRVNIFFSEIKDVLSSKDVIIIEKIKKLNRIKTEFTRYHIFKFKTIFDLTACQSKVKFIFCLFILSMSEWGIRDD